MKMRFLKSIAVALFAFFVTSCDNENDSILHDNYIAHVEDDQVELIESVLEEGEGVALISECHLENSVEFFTFPKQCVMDTTETDFVDSIDKYRDRATVYLKNSTNAIFAPGMLADLEKSRNLKEVIICGCCTDICVLNFSLSLKTYFNQKNKNVRVFVVKSATETYDAPDHNRDEYNKIAYSLMNVNGIEVVKDLKHLKEREIQLGLTQNRRGR